MWVQELVNSKAKSPEHGFLCSFEIAFPNPIWTITNHDQMEIFWILMSSLRPAPTWDHINPPPRFIHSPTYIYIDRRVTLRHTLDRSGGQLIPMIIKCIKIKFTHLWVHQLGVQWHSPSNLIMWDFKIISEIFTRISFPTEIEISLLLFSPLRSAVVAVWLERSDFALRCEWKGCVLNVDKMFPKMNCHLTSWGVNGTVIV